MLFKVLAVLFTAIAKMFFADGQVRW